MKSGFAAFRRVVVDNPMEVIVPLLIFAASSPFARLGHVFGIERTLAACLALAVVGIALRSLGSIIALFAGTAIFGGSGPAT